MSVLAVIAPQADPRLTAAVEANFGNGNHFQFAPGQYVVYTPTLTTQQVSQLLGVPNGGIGRVVIFSIANYGGWHVRDLWEWIAAHLGPASPPQAPAEAQDE
jgi:hypothetical protein